MTQRRAIQVLLAALLLFALFAAYAWKQNRDKQHRRLCREQVLDLEGAKEQFALEHDGHPPESVAELAPRFIHPLPLCPSGGSYVLGDMQKPAQCSLLDHQFQW